MKKIILILCLMGFNSFSQSKNDTIENGTIRNDSLFFTNGRDAMLFMRNNFHNFHKDYKVGIVVSVIGGLGVGVGLVTKNNGVSYAGYGVGILGTILMIVSHKSIGNAGNWYFEPNGVTLKF